MQKSVKEKIFGALPALLWLTGSIFIIYIMFNFESFFRVTSNPIGHIDTSQGTLSVRSEDDVSWKETNLNEFVYEGDRLSTSFASSGKIIFSQGRSLEIGEDTQISLTTIKQGNDNHIIVNLINGIVSGNVATNSPFQLIIFSGQQSFYLTPGKKVGIEKSVGEKSKQVEIKKMPLAGKTFSKPIVSPVVPPVAVPKPNLPSNFAAAIKAPSLLALNQIKFDSIKVAIQKNEEPPKITLKHEEPKLGAPKILSPENNTSWLTQLPFEDIKNIKINISLSENSLPNTPGGWSKMRTLEIISEGKKATYELTNPDARQVSIYPRQVMELNSTPKSVKSFSIKVIDSLIQDKQVMKRFVSESKDYKISSLDYVFKSKQPVTLSIPSLALKKSSKLLSYTSLGLSTSNAPYIFSATSGASLKPFAGYLLEFKQIGIKEKTSLEDKGLYLVKNQKIIMQVGGSALKEEDIQRMLTAFQADYCFEGSRGALLDVPLKNLESKLVELRKSEKLGKKIYLASSGRVIPVNDSFMSQHPQVVRFITRNATSLFTENVRIISRAPAGDGNESK